MGEQTSKLSIEQQQKAEFRMMFDELVDETRVLSGNFLNNPGAQRVLDYGTQAIPWLLEYLRESREDSEEVLHHNPWVAFEVIQQIVPPEELPLVPKEASGYLSRLLEIFDVWGVEKGYISPAPPEEIK